MGYLLSEGMESAPTHPDVNLGTFRKQKRTFIRFPDVRSDDENSGYTEGTGA